MGDYHQDRFDEIKALLVSLEKAEYARAAADKARADELRLAIAPLIVQARADEILELRKLEDGSAAVEVAVAALQTRLGLKSVTSDKNVLRTALRNNAEMLRNLVGEEQASLTALLEWVGMVALPLSKRAQGRLIGIMLGLLLMFGLMLLLPLLLLPLLLQPGP